MYDRHPSPFSIINYSDTAENSAMHEDCQTPPFEVHPDVSGSMCTEHSECNKEKTASAPVPAEGAKLASMCISGELCMHVHRINACI